MRLEQLQKNTQEVVMISVGIDVSKGKSTACAMKPYGEIVASPFEFQHTETDLKSVCDMFHRMNDEVRIVMEATGIYHLPVATYLIEHGMFVAVVNPYEMKQYRMRGLRKVKTDRTDSMMIAGYGIDYWYSLKEFQVSHNVYDELRILSRQYRHHMQLRISALLGLTHLLDYTLPGIKRELKSWNEDSGKDKLGDFVDQYWHYANITKMTESKFISHYCKWAVKKGYHQNQSKAAKIYSMAKEGIPTLPANQTTKMLVHEAVEVLKRVNETLNTILARMKELAKSLPEYPVVRAMGGVGETLAPRLIADIGDVRRFHSSKALIAFAGIDAPPYQSGQFIGTERHISKRGSSAIRKTGYEVMRSLKSHKEPDDSAVYHFMLKKEAEGKPKKVAKVAGLNKFLRIYYARVQEVYSE